ncbi:methyltransferase domain-containing protein [Cohnella faecalis]|nr:methyltransferase domain-containing protein [Cohnella faecalis]
MSEITINSKSYWDNRFRTNWEAYLGREQTAFFYHLALKMMPDWLLEEIERKQFSICDAGCAEGDGTQLLASRFAQSRVVGLDFSEEAISKAKSYYPDVLFQCSGIENMEERYDVILSSNTLEHFDDPFAMIRQMMNSVGSYLILLLPFEEYQRIPEHSYTFDYDVFPLKLNGFHLVFSQEVNCSVIPGTHWPGKQLLVVYANPERVRIEDIPLSSFYDPSRFNELQARIDAYVVEIGQYKDEIKGKDEEVLKRSVELQLAKDEIASLLVRIQEQRQELERKDQQLFALAGQLNEIHSSGFWKAATKYYRLRDHTPGLKYVYKTLRLWKREGLRVTIKRGSSKIKKAFQQPASLNKSHLTKMEEMLHIIKVRYENNELEGIAILPSAFEFEELYNQRTINLAKYLSKQNYAVLFVAWQWNHDEVLLKANQEVYRNVFELPLYGFLAGLDLLESLSSISRKLAFLTMPNETFYRTLPTLRAGNYSIVYDILDEWEHFHKVGQAPWYDKAIEEAFILNSDLVVTVSEPLKQKFSSLRNDIRCIGNGYDPSLLKADISLKTKAADGKIHIGYFGHLTDSWFDWGLVLELADRNSDMVFHIIGYGHPEFIEHEVKKRTNVILYGKVAPNELYRYVRQWHLAIIPFLGSQLSEAVDPIKIYEYLYFGLPAIVTGIPHIGNYPLVTYCEDKRNMAELLRSGYERLAAPEPERNGLDRFLAETTWDARFSEIMRLIPQIQFLQRIYDDNDE